MKTSPSVPLRPNLYQSAPVAAAARGEAEAVEASLFWRLALWSALAAFFILYSRFFDLAANGLKVPRIILSLMVLFFLLSGQLLVFLRSTAGKILVLLLGWVSVTMLFSVWKGGSIPPYYQLCQSTLVFAVAASLPLAMKNVKTMMSTLAFAGLVAALMSIPWGAYPSGRLSLMNGSYYDPNYYAMCLGAIAPFFWAMAAGSRSIFVKIIGWTSLIPVLVTFARNGSRGSMFGFLIMLVVLFFISSAQAKILIAAATFVAVVVALVAMPEYLRERYFTIFEIDSSAVEQLETPSTTGGLSDYNRLQADTSSAQDRKRLLLRSIDLTFEHPLFGVGPGNFPTAVYDESKAAGAPRNEWLVTHNSYTELSSETGIPGLILFLCFIAAGFHSLIFVLKRAKEDGVRPNAVAYATAKYLLLSMVSLSISIFFLAVGYEFTIYLWAGMAVALRRTYEALPVAAEEAEEQPQLPQQRAVPSTPVFAPAYAKSQGRGRTARETAAEPADRRIRFNRFRS